MENLNVTLHTNQGDIKLRLFPDIAPKACENFATHAEKGYYNGIIFHRVIKEFMIQGGDPTGTGMGGESIWGKPFKDECTAEATFDREGLLAMANAGPGTNGSQFFITCAATPWLNMRHTIFGEVVEGLDVVKNIENCEVGRADRPVDNQEIQSATVSRT
jgi:peptidylprolyl isomerase